MISIMCNLTENVRFKILRHCLRMTFFILRQPLFSGYLYFNMSELVFILEPTHDIKDDAE